MGVRDDKIVVVDFDLRYLIFLVFDLNNGLLFISFCYVWKFFKYFRVIGIKGLCVVDVFIMFFVIVVNINVFVIMIVEKVVDVILNVIK